ncbi:MAG: hypothetical protein SFV19_13765 [Rhodospirillaceae bacterium]|nr:hypothetical protein [Rhodospirillaceae bacterium]
MVRAFRNFRPRSARRLSGAGLLALCLQGCAQDSRGIVIDLDGDPTTRHVMVLGFGIVSMPKATAEASVTAVRTQSLGVSLSDLPGIALNAGYASSQVVAMPDGMKDVVVEFESTPFGKVCLRAPASDGAVSQSPQSICSKEKTP